MTKITLRDWVLIMTLAPTLLIGLVLGTYFTFNRYAEVDSDLHERGRNIIEPLAMFISDELIYAERTRTTNLFSKVQSKNQSLIRNITLFDTTNQVFATTGYSQFANQLKLPSDSMIREQTTFEELDEFILVRTPVYKNHDYDDEVEIAGYLVILLIQDSAIIEQQAAVLQSLLIVLAAILISLFFTTKILRAVTNPVTAIVNAIDKIREGKLETRISGSLIGELNLLKNGVNAIARSLNEYQNEMHRNIDQATSDLRETLEQMEIQNIELDIAKRKAQEANRVKSEFLANMSHELRTPLNGVIGFTRQVLKTPLAPNQHDYLTTIDKSANNLLAIINDILDFSKLDAGRMVLENIPFSLRDTVDESLTLMAPIAHDKQLDLSVRIAPDTPNSLVGDPTRIKQILMNLIGNAIKFTAKGSVNVDIKLDGFRKSKAELRFSVADTGIGISAEQQETLFEAFGQADSSVTRRYGGTGLGLVIAKRLVNAMDGELHMTSELNHGSVFWFTVMAELSELNFAEQLDCEELQDKSILYIEKHEHTRIAIEELLLRWKLDVTTKSSFDPIYKLNDNDNFDIVLLGVNVNPSSVADIKLICQKLCMHTSNLHLLVNSTSPNLREALIGAGASSCQTKPISPVKLNTALRSPYRSEILAKPQEASTALVPLKVLAVDDNEANLKLIHAFLSEQVREIKTATNGREALELCNQEVFNLIFMDIQMPVMDGVTACNRISEASLNETTPIIAVTAHAMAGEKEKLLQQGFSAYLTKPLDESTLRECIMEFCADQQSMGMQHGKIKEPMPFLSEPAATQAIDWKLAMVRAGGKEDLARDMLDMLVDSLPKAQHEVKTAFEQQQRDDLIREVHKLHGACCYTGVPKLKQVAEHLETRLKQNAPLPDLEPELFELVDEIDNVLNQHAEMDESKVS